MRLCGKRGKGKRRATGEDRKRDRGYVPTGPKVTKNPWLLRGISITGERGGTPPRKDHFFGKTGNKRVSAIVACLSHKLKK
jgi:hypothetical protein